MALFPSSTTVLSGKSWLIALISAVVWVSSSILLASRVNRLRLAYCFGGFAFRFARIPPTASKDFLAPFRLGRVLNK